MKKLCSLAIALLSFITLAIAQPQKMTYQSVVRNSNNELVVNHQVGVRVSILEDSVNGPMIYRETHTPTTNANGLVTIMIGDGIHPYTNTLADVNWDKHTHFLSVEIDPTGGTNYTIFGAQQLVSVPYAFYSESARYVDTAAYAVNAFHADTAYYLANFQNSDTSLFAYNADTAAFSHNANNAVSANYANTAGTANYSDSARIANVSNTANYANTSGSASYSDSARIANSAISANYATSAGSAATATSALYADSTQVADFAHNANNAVNSNYAITSGSSNYSDSARISNYANSANTANSATSAQTADYADSARIANASNTANYANTSGSAAYSDSARIANIAISANYATSAGSAATATSALYADSTKNANYADSSDYNHLVNRPLGNNTGDILYWNATDSSWHIVPVGNIGETLTLDSNYVPYWHVGNAVNAVNLPTLTTDSVTNVTTTTASAFGNVISDGGSALVFYGVCWDTVANPTTLKSHTFDGMGVGQFTSSLSGLAMGTQYHVRAYATNSAGTNYGNDVTFTTPTYPTVITAAMSNISITTATSGGNVTSDGGAPVIARGVCWSTSITPTIFDGHTTDGVGTGNFTSNITGLTATRLIIFAHTPQIVFVQHTEIQ